jgi:hypothetical protein
MAAYEKCLAAELIDYEYAAESVREALARLPQVS